MWEFEIVCNRQNSTYISFVSEGVAETLKETEGVSAVCADSDNIFLSIGCKKQKSTKLKARLKMLLADVICEKVKFEFLRDRMPGGHLGQEYNYILAKICTYFDNELDKQIVFENIKFDDNIFNIESFFDFRLIALKNKWLELCNIACNNAFSFSTPENFADLVQFLLSNIEIKSQSVILEMREKCMIYHDKRRDFDIISAIDPMDKFLVLGKLIELNPLVIKIHSSAECEETLNLVKNVFKDKVIIN